MIRKSDTDQGWIITCDHCGLSAVSTRETFREVVQQITKSGGEVRQEARRTGKGYGPSFWRNYCKVCAPIEGIFL